jgi:hypothetical protein
MIIIIQITAVKWVGGFFLLFFRRSLGYSFILFKIRSFLDDKRKKREQDSGLYFRSFFFFPYSYHDNVNEFQKMTTKTTGAVTATIYTHAAGTDVTVIL